MTITIADGRGALWQWDTGRRLRVGSGVEQIHYQNRALGCSVDVDVGADGTAIIPDELLQDCHTLTAYVYVTDDTGAYTMEQQDFIVHKRAKPAGYVYTPTDQMTLQMIQRQIGDLADLTTEAKENLVAAINEAARTGGGAGSIDLRVADGYVQYSTDGGMTWTNLIAIADLEGADGITPHIGDNGNWYLGSTDTGKPSRGETGSQGAPGIYYGTTQPTGDTHPVWIDPDGDHDDGGLLPAVTAADNGKFLHVVNGAWAAADMPSGGSSDFIINATLTDDGTTCTLDKTFAQIQEAVQAGKKVYAQLNAGLTAHMPLVLYNTNALFFGATTTTYNDIELYALAVTASEAKFVGKSAVTYTSDGDMPQVSMAAAPTMDMQIATKKYVDDHAGGGTDMGITGATIGQIAKITAVDASGVPTAWAPVDMPSGGTGGSGGETWELVAEATTTDVVNSMRVTFDACSAVYVEFCWGGVENDLGDIAIYPNTGDTPYAGEKRAAAAYVNSSASIKRGMLCVRMDCRVGTHWTAVSNQKGRADGAFGSINADNLMNMDIDVYSDVQYSVINSGYMTIIDDTPASGVKSITAYGAGMAIGTRIKVWGIKK